MDRKFLENSLIIVTLLWVLVQLWFHFSDRRNTKLKF